MSYKKIVRIKENRSCHLCRDVFTTMTKMLSVKAFPTHRNKDCYMELAAPLTIHICFECCTDEEKKLYV